MELVLPPLHREAQVDDALMLLHEADNQGDQALIAGALRDIAVERAVRPQVCRLAGLVARRAGRVGGVIQRAQPRRIHLAGGEPDGSDLEHEAKLKYLLDVAQRDRGDRVPCLPRETINPSWRSRIMALRIGALLMP